MKNSSKNVTNSKNAPPATGAKTGRASLLIPALQIRAPGRSLPAELTVQPIIPVPAHQPHAAAESTVPKAHVSTAPKGRAAAVRPAKSPTVRADAILLRIRVRPIPVLHRLRAVRILRDRLCAGVRLCRAARAKFVRTGRVRSVRPGRAVIVLRDMKRTVRGGAGLRTSVWG